MTRRSLIQGVLCLGLGGSLGLLAASGVTSRPAQAAGAPVCCSNGNSRVQLLAEGNTTTGDAEPTSEAAPNKAAAKQPNIVVIMGDDVGWFNIGAYHQGIMSGKTPNLDKLASQGMRFTDYY